MFVARLERINNTQDLCRIATRGCRVAEDRSNLLVWVNDKHGADGEGDAFLVNVGSVLVVEPILPCETLFLR